MDSRWLRNRRVIESLVCRLSEIEYELKDPKYAGNEYAAEMIIGVSEELRVSIFHFMEGLIRGDIVFEHYRFLSIRVLNSVDLLRKLLEELIAVCIQYAPDLYSPDCSLGVYMNKFITTQYDV